jgi:hypothetical protein
VHGAPRAPLPDPVPVATAPVSRGGHPPPPGPTDVEHSRLRRVMAALLRTSRQTVLLVRRNISRAIGDHGRYAPKVFLRIVTFPRDRGGISYKE